MHEGDILHEHNVEEIQFYNCLWDNANLRAYDVIFNVVNPLVEFGDVHLPIFSSGIRYLQPVQ